MKKTIYSLLIIVISVTAAFSQGIYFSDSYEGALKRAEKQNLGVFIDVYTEWCGPCKEMDKNVFTDNSVRDYFNRNFANLKIDAEKGEGIEIAKKYGVKSYPTLIFLDSKGNFVHKISGALNADRLIYEAKKSKSSEVGKLTLMEEKYVSGDMNREETLEYLKLLKQVDLDYQPVFDEYIKGYSKKEVCTIEVYDLIRRYTTTPSGYASNLLIKRYRDFSKVVNKESFDQFLYNRYCFQTYRNSNNHESNGPMYELLLSSGFEYVPALKENFSLVKMLKDKSKHSEVAIRAKKMLKTYPLASSMFLNEAVKQAGSSKIMEDYCEEALHTYASWNKIGAARTSSSMAYLYLLNHQDYEKALKYYTLCSEWNPNDNSFKGNMEYCQKSLGLIKCENYGEIAPNFTLRDSNGKNVSLSDFKGKYVVLDFWASWCGPCKGELPYLQKVNEKYKGMDVEIISVSIDEDEEAWMNAIQKDEMTWNQLIVESADVKKDYNISGIPRIILIGKDGEILADGLRGVSIERAVKSVL